MPTTVTIQPWPDPILDTLGHDPRSAYAETFWLPTLGPTALLLLRHLASRFEMRPGPVELRVADTSAALGLGERDGNSSPIVRTLDRLAQFELAVSDGATTYAVRRNLPQIHRRHVRRLPAHLQAAHAEWTEHAEGETPLAASRRRARRLALVLLEQGDDRDRVERFLHATGFHPAIAAEAATWAWNRHTEAAKEAGLMPAGAS